MGQQKELEVTVLSAQDLKNVAMLGAMDPYCVAWLYPHTKVSGPVSKGGGVHPTWNAIITLVAEESLLEQGDAAVTVEIYNHSTFSNKLIGSAIVPLADVQGTSKAGTGSTKATAYQVRKKSGNYQGVINVAVRVGRTLSESEVAAKSGPPSMGMPAMAAMAGGQYGQQQQQYYPQQQQYYPQQQQQYYPQQQQPYYPQQQQQYYPQQQQQYAPPGQYSQAGYPPQQKPKRGFGGAGLGLGAGLLGGYVLGSALDGGDGGGDGGGGCGGGGCGGGCGG